MSDPRDQRLRSRVRLELPVRLRQIAPPRNLVEVARTLDVSRNGILFRTKELYDLRTTVWVAMPYHPNAASPDPEFPSSVVRVDRLPEGLAEVALLFHSGHADYRTFVATPGEAAPLPRSERRTKNRVRMALPIRVRGTGTAEESVTLDVSRTGVLFRSDQPYPVGQTVWVAVPFQRGTEPAEVPARIVRVLESEPPRAVALQYSHSIASRASTPSF